MSKIILIEPEDIQLFNFEKGKRASKQWNIILFFIVASFRFNQKESLVKDHNNELRNPHHFYSYPREIMRSLGAINISISLKTITITCNKYSGDIFQRYHKVGENRPIRDHNYILKNDSNALLEIIHLLKKSLSVQSQNLIFHSEPFQSLINPTLIREVLSESESYIERIVPLDDWGKDEGQHILNFFYGKEVSHYLSCQSLVRENPNIQTLEKSWKKKRSKWLSMINKEPGKDYEYLLSEARNAEILFDRVKEASIFIKSFKERHFAYSYSFPVYSDIFIKTLKNSEKIISKSPYGFTIIFPVFKSSISDEEKLKKLLKVNEKIIADFPIIKIAKKGLLDHYKDEGYEYWQIIRPIQILLLHSIEGLEMFLMKNPKTNKYDFGPIIQSEKVIHDNPFSIKTSNNLLPLVFSTLKSISLAQFELNDSRFFQILIGSNPPYQQDNQKFLQFYCGDGVKISFEPNLRIYNKENSINPIQWNWFNLEFIPSVYMIVRGFSLLPPISWKCWEKRK